MSENIKPYPKYKNSEYDWLGQVPKHWEERYLFQCATEQKLSNKTVHHQNLLSLSYGRIKRKDINTTSGLLPENFDNYQIVNKGNLILRLTDLQNDHKSLRTGLVTETGIITSAYVCLKCADETNPDFFHEILHSYDVCKLFYGLGGGLRQGCSFKDLKKIRIYLPPLPEQTQIVKYLDSKVSLINKFIKDKKLEIKLLKEQKQGEINHSVTKGLNPAAPMKNSGIDWIGEIPVHWEVRRLKNIFKSNIESLSNNTNPSQQISYLDISSVGFGFLKQEPEKYLFKDAPSRARRILHEGDIIVSTVRTYLKSLCYISKDLSMNIASTGFAVLTPIKEYNTEFLSKLLSVSYFIDNIIKNSFGISYPAINDNRLMSQKIALPINLEEQKQIVDYITIVEDRINTAITAIEKQIALIQEYKTSLISDVVTGKIDVRNIVVEDLVEELEELEEALEEDELEQTEI